ncbi:MAG: mannosyltransferase [Thermoleophilaceae bacterium]|nr:mannosyltransferase [Thermoleophilaceae bacterium]
MARNERLALAALIVLAAAVRLWQIGDQSFWLDEAFTVDLVKRPFGDMLSATAQTESTPPLYYALAWLWAKLFGHGEAGLRSMSALFGTLTVPVAWRAGRELFSPRVGLIAAALVAVNPFFVWYSQEARSYALLVLMAALSLLFLERALRDRTPRAFALWALVAVLGLLTHYFAAFLLVPEAIWLVWATRERAAWLATGALAAAGAALAPLALHQRARGHTTFIGDLSLGRRVVDLPKKLVTGELGTPTPLIGPLAGLIAVAALAYALSRTERDWRRSELLLLGLAAAAALVPLVLALAGADYLLPRNLIALYVPLLVAVAAGLGAPGAGRLGVAGAAAICAVALVVNIEVASDAKLQRDDWRGMAAALGPAAEPRAIVLTPDFAKKPLRLYAGSMPPMAAAGAPVREIDVIGNDRPPALAAPPPPAGFTQFARTRTASYLLVRYRAPTAQPVDPQQLAGLRVSAKPPAILLQPPSARKDPAQ